MWHIDLRRYLESLNVKQGKFFFYRLLLLHLTASAAHRLLAVSFVSCQLPQRTRESTSVKCRALQDRKFTGPLSLSRSRRHPHVSSPEISHTCGEGEIHLSQVMKMTSYSGKLGQGMTETNNACLLNEITASRLNNLNFYFCFLTCWCPLYAKAALSLPKCVIVNDKFI